MPRSSQVFLFNSHDLPRRAGEMKEYASDITVPDRVGIDVIAVLPGEVIHVDLRLESVAEGVLVSAQIGAIADGECMRCLDPVEFDINRSIQELYRYEPEKAHTKAQRKRARQEQDDLDEDEEPSEDEREKVPKSMKTKHGYLKDGFVVDAAIECGDEDDDDDEDYD